MSATTQKVSPDATAGRAANVQQMEDKMSQLRALTSLISGEGFENLQSYNDEIQNNVLWLVSSLAAEVQDLYRDIRRSA
jgi:hypothetical protein